MKISIESPTRIKMIPEAEHEKEGLDALWKTIIRCDEDSKVLCPIGAYMASEDEGAEFAISGPVIGATGFYEQSNHHFGSW